MVLTLLPPEQLNLSILHMTLQRSQGLGWRGRKIQEKCWQWRRLCVLVLQSSVLSKRVKLISSATSSAPDLLIFQLSKNPLMLVCFCSSLEWLYWLASSWMTTLAFEEGTGYGLAVPLLVLLIGCFLPSISQWTCRLEEVRFSLPYMILVWLWRDFTSFCKQMKGIW